jgi:uncharacterized protein GlcG (DUF336 family)
MIVLTLADAETIASGALAAGKTRNMAPLCVVVLDLGAKPLVLHRSENAGFYRAEIAIAKAAGCLGMGLGGRELQRRAAAAPAFYQAFAGVASAGLIPVPGGVLLRDADGAVVGAVGVSGDSADNDEIAALAGIAMTRFKPDTGAKEASP